MNGVLLVSTLALLALVGCKRNDSTGSAATGSSPAAAPVVAANAPAPTLPEKAIFEPTITGKQGSTAAGTAFAIKHPEFDTPIILTCLHIFGKAGGYKVDVPAAQVPTEFQSVKFIDKFSSMMYDEKAVKFIPLPQAAPLGEPSPVGDIVALWAPAKWSLATLPLATTAPQPGEPLWLASRTHKDPDPARRLYKATAIGISDNLLEFRFDDASLDLLATSGSPVLNQKGEVVGIHLGGGKQGNALHGYCNPASIFGTVLIEAARKSK